MERVWLRGYRDKKKMTHEQVAKASKITRQYYGMIEGGVSNPSVDVAKKIAQALGFKWTFFFDKASNETLPDTQHSA